MVDESTVHGDKVMVRRFVFHFSSPARFSEKLQKKWTSNCQCYCVSWFLLNNFPWSELLSIIDDVVKISFEQFDAISVVHNSTCIDLGQLLSIRFLQITLFRLSLFSYAVNRDALSATLETRGERHGAEMCPAIASGIVTGEALVSYWPILSLVPGNSPRRLCKSYSAQFPPL